MPKKRKTRSTKKRPAQAQKAGTTTPPPGGEKEVTAEFKAGKDLEA